MEKPNVDQIEGLSPAISIDQKGSGRNPRSTVGTVTEVYDYLRLLYARIGQPHCPTCGEPITQQTATQIVDGIMEMPEGTRLLTRDLLAESLREDTHLPVIGQPELIDRNPGLAGRHHRVGIKALGQLSGNTPHAEAEHKQE